MVLVPEEKEEVIKLVEQQWAKYILREQWGWMLTYIQSPNTWWRTLWVLRLDQIPHWQCFDEPGVLVSLASELLVASVVERLWKNTNTLLGIIASEVTTCCLTFDVC